MGVGLAQQLAASCGMMTMMMMVMMIANISGKGKPNLSELGSDMKHINTVDTI
jgi:hypothetical protein